MSKKLNSTKTRVDLQQVIRPHSPTGRNVVIINTVERNILLGTKMSPRILRSIEQLQKLPDVAVVFEVGVALQYLNAPPGVSYSAPYREMGIELWEAARYELQSFLCEKSERTTKEWVEELVSGDIREASIAVLTVLIASLSVPLSIAVPLTALLVKKGLKGFCKLKAKKPKRSVSEIISSRGGNPQRRAKKKGA